MNLEDKIILGSLAVNNKNKNGRSEMSPFDFSGSLAKTVLNSLSANIAIIDEYGVILETNKAWRNYATENKMKGSDDSIFYLSIDPARQILEWVRAGHEPAICYDPAANDFLELSGSGMALGVDKQCQYEINRKEGLSRESIIVMGTDGVWETRNESGQMFGRTAIYEIIRNNSAASAGSIMEEIFDRYKKFRKAAQPEDDVTLVVVKLN